MEALLVSKCLFGENVRYDGGNCLMRGDYLARLKNKFEIISICPEVMAGMPTPRNPIEKFEDKIINKNGEDLTHLFNPVLLHLTELVKKNKIKFALLKELSPSCGSKKIYNGSFSDVIIDGEGLIAAHLKTLGVQVYSEGEVESLIGPN